MPWSSSSGSAIHHTRRKRGPRHREGEEEEEDDKERQDSDGKRKPSTYLSPREYSIWTLNTQSLVLTDVTGNLPLRVEAWTSPYFQATSVIAVSLQVSLAQVSMLL